MKVPRGRREAARARGAVISSRAMGRASPGGERPGRRRLAAELVVLVTASALAMGSGLGGGLLNWDDDRFVRDNEMIRGLSAANLGTILSGPHFEAYHPVHLMSYCVDFALYGLWAPGYKVHNLVLYCLCVVLVFALMLELGLGRAAALAGALLFAVHPLHVETVVWVTARKEPLSLAFMLGSALAHLRSASPRDRAGLLSLALFLLALLTKTSTVVLPGLLLLVDVLVRRRPWRPSLLRLAPMAAVALAVGLYVVSLWQENEMARPMPERGATGLVALVGKTYWHHLSSIVVPTRLSPVYPIDRVGAFDGAAAAGFGAMAVAGLALWRAGDRLLALGGAWVGVALLPVSNAVPVYFFVQDRYALIATVGAALLAGRAVDLALSRPAVLWPARAGLALVVVALGAASTAQAAHWRTSLELWRRATAAQPGAYYGFLALGHTERDLGRLDRAVEAYRSAVALEPALPHARISLCLADAMRVVERRGTGSVDEVGRALRREWRSPPGLLELAGGLQLAGFDACAVLAESRAFDLTPPEPRALVAAASRWTAAGQGALALRYLDRAEAAGLGEDETTLEVRAQALELVGRGVEARAALARSFELAPRPPLRLIAAADRLLDRGRPELALLYADVAGRTGELAERWGEVRHRAAEVLRGQTASR